MNATTLKIGNDEYHANHSRVSNSMLSVLEASPPRFYAQYIARTYTPDYRDEFTIGSAGHDVLLEGGDKVIEIPPEVLSIDGKRSGGNWKMWSSLNADKIQLKREDYRQVMGMVESVRSRKPAAEILSWEGVREEAIYWTDQETGIECKCKPDIRCQRPYWASSVVVADIKTTISADPESFAASAFKFGYHRQAAFYERGVTALTGVVPEFYFIAVEKTPPYVCRVFELGDEFMERGRLAVGRLMAELARRRESNDWDVDHGDLVLSLPEPRWAKYENDYQVEV